MKKCILMLLTLFVLSTTEISTFAANEAAIVMSDISTNAGESVDVVLALENNPGIFAMRVSLTYDSSVMKLVSVTDGGIFVSKNHNVSENILFWEGDWDKYTDITTNGTLCTLSFDIAEGASAGDYNISLSYSDGDICNTNFDSIAVNVSDKAVVSILPAGGDDDGEPTISAPVSVVQGNNVTIAAELTGTANGGKIIGAMYDASGNMIECHLYDPAQTVNVVFTKSGGSYAEIYWWEDMTSITPACENETVAILAAN